MSRSWGKRQESFETSDLALIEDYTDKAFLVTEKVKGATYFFREQLKELKGVFGKDFAITARKNGKEVETVVAGWSYANFRLESVQHFLETGEIIEAKLTRSQVESYATDDITKSLSYLLASFKKLKKAEATRQMKIVLQELKKIKIDEDAEEEEEEEVVEKKVAIKRTVAAAIPPPSVAQSSQKTKFVLDEESGDDDEEQPSESAPPLFANSRPFVRR